MKLVRNLAATLFLACALTVTVYAGDQETPGAKPMQTPPTTSTTDKTGTTAATDGKVDTEEIQKLEEDLLISALLALVSWL